MNRYRRQGALVATLLVLSACGTPVPPVAAGEDQQVDQATERLKTEQDRTDQAETLKRNGVAEPQQRRSVGEIAVHPVLNSNVQPDYHPAAIHSPSGNNAVIR